MSFNPTEFLNSNVYHSSGSSDGYAVVTTSVSKLLGVIAENTSGGTRWVQVHDAAAQPSPGAVPILSIKAVTGQQVSFDPSPFICLVVKNGLVVASSTTGPTYTAGGSSDLWMTVFYI